MKLIHNSAKIEVVDNAIRAVGSKVGTVNRNGMKLLPDSLVFDRERYPFLFEHGDNATDVIGDTHTEYDPEREAYMTEIEVYEENAVIARAVKNGAYDAISIAYYLDEYHFEDDGDTIVVEKAYFKEVSLVSVPADPEAKFVNNGLSDEVEKERQLFVLEQNNLKEFKEIKVKYE